MDRLLQEIVNWLKMIDKQIVIGISGHGAAGKTTFTDINYLRQSHEERRIQYELFMHRYSQHFDIIIKSSNKAISVEKNTIEFIST